MTEQPKNRLVIVERLRVLWCGLVHDAPTWPIHGSYRPPHLRPQLPGPVGRGVCSSRPGS